MDLSVTLPYKINFLFILLALLCW